MASPSTGTLTVAKLAAWPAHPSHDFSLPEGVPLPASLADEQEVAKYLQSMKEQVARTEGANEPTNKVAKLQEGQCPSVVRTENNAATYDNSGSSRIDFFFNVLEGTPAEQVHELLAKAWDESPDDAMKLVAHLRDIRSGKGEREKMYDALEWLRRQHPLTLIANLQQLAQVGYWKDLLNLVQRAAIGEEEAQKRRQQRQEFEAKTKASVTASRKACQKAAKERRGEWVKQLKALETEEAKAAAREERRAAMAEKARAARAQQQEQRRSKRLNAILNARGLLQNDPFYRLLHLSVAVLFAQQLSTDLQTHKAGKQVSSMAAKWAPSPAHCHDRDTCIASTIAELLYPRQHYQQPGEPYQVYVERARRQYHKDYLVPLRLTVPLPEVMMSAGRWCDVKYDRVASVCMKTHKGLFEEHDKERFEAYLADVRSGKKKIAAGALKPHELVREALAAARGYMASDSDDEEPSATSVATMEAQWKSYVEQLKQAGALNSALAVCDVSGSMSGEPMQVAIALSLLVAEVAAPPFNQLVCTFSAQPQLHVVTGDSLVDKVKDLAAMEWGMNTDVQAVFNLVLQRAVEAKVRPADMIKTLFVFSDMEFDACVTFNGDIRAMEVDSDSGDDDGSGAPAPPAPAPGKPATNFEVAKAAFAAAGYELPNVVFWNLRASDRTHSRGVASSPVRSHDSGAALVSGFSGQLLKLFMGNELFDKKDEFTAMHIMQMAISKYNDWVVVD